MKENNVLVQEPESSALLPWIALKENLIYNSYLRHTYEWSMKRSYRAGRSVFMKVFYLENLYQK